MKKIAFVISHKPDIRYQKRIDLLKNINDIFMIYWNKEDADVNFSYPYVKCSEIKIPANRTNPLKRLPQTYLYTRKAYKKICELNPDYLYVGNLDMLSIAVKYKKRHPKTKIVYEIADLHRLIIDKQTNFLKKVLSYLLKEEEKDLIKFVDLLVLTSMKFYDVYYHSLIGKNKVVFMPNMPEEGAFDGFCRLEHSGFNVAFVGSIRYKNQLRMLIEAGGATSTNVIFAGVDKDGPEFEQECGKYPFVSFRGEFNYKKEIQDIYSKVDCIYAVYDADMANVRVALPNKLYEAVMTGIPIIVAKNTYLAELVESMGIGFAVSHKNVKELVNAINSIKDKGISYKVMCNNCVHQQKEQQLTKYNNFLLSKLRDLD